MASSLDTTQYLRGVPGNQPFSRKDVVAISLLLAFFCYLFRDILAGHRLIGIDFEQFYLPMKRFLYDEIRLHQAVPYWNPYIFGGMPYLAHFESTLFYPLGFLFYLLPPETAYGYTMFLHFCFAGLFMYLLARSLGTGIFGSFISAAVFTCNGFLMAILFLGHLSPVQSYVWLPAVIYFLNRSVRSPKPWESAMTAGGLWGIQILAGAPQDAFYTFLASALFLLCSVGGDQALRASAMRLLVTLATMFTTGAGLSSIQIIPAFELIRESVRASLDTYEMVTMGSFPLEGVITALLPNFFGSYADGTLWVGNVPWSIPHQNLYTGILAVVLLGFVSLQWKERKRLLLFGGLLALAALVLSFGHHTPIYRFAYLFPGFDRFRAPSKIMVLWAFSIGLLAGMGMDGLFRYLREKRVRRLFLFFLGVISLIVLDIASVGDPSRLLRLLSPFVLSDALPGKMVEAVGVISSSFHRMTIVVSLLFMLILLMRRNLLPVSIGAAILCAVLVMDLAHVHGKAVRCDDGLYQTMERIKRSLADSLGRDEAVFRVGSFTHPLGANLEMYLGYQTVNGFTALFPSRFYEYMNRYSENRLPPGWVNFFYGNTRNSALMDLLNVKYEISHLTRSYELRQSFLPRAFMMTDYQILDRDDVLNHMTQPSFDPRKAFFFEKDDLIEGPLRYPARQSNASGSIQLTRYRPDLLRIETDTSEPGYLFLSEIFYPGWKALVDGEPQRILRGNYLFRVIELPEGRHRVELVFDPYTIKVGMAVSSLMTVLLLCFRFRRLFMRVSRKKGNS